MDSGEISLRYTGELLTNSFTKSLYELFSDFVG